MNGFAGERERETLEYATNVTKIFDNWPGFDYDYEL